MRDFNKAIILGNLTRDPEMRYTPNGKAVCSFVVATNRRWNDADGNLQESAEYHSVVAWGKLAETASQILRKGRKVLVEGRLQTRNWEGQDGVKRSKTEIIAENFSALGPAKSQEESPEEIPVQAAEEPDLEKVIEEMPEEKESKDQKAKSKEAEKKTKKTAIKGEEDKIDLDDIPF